MTQANRDARPWYERALDRLAPPTQQERSEWPEDAHDRRVREQHEQYEAELRNRAVNHWRTDKTERAYIKDIKREPRHLRKELVENLIQKRMEFLRRHDDEEYRRQITSDPDPTLRERVGHLVRGKREPDR